MLDSRSANNFLKPIFSTPRFTHVLVSSIAKGEWFANSTKLQPFWDVGNFLRASSPYENETAFDLANAALKKQVRLSALAGVAEDIEIHPFPYYSATKQGGVVNFTDLAGRIRLLRKDLSDKEMPEAEVEKLLNELCQESRRSSDTLSVAKTAFG